MTRLLRALLLAFLLLLFACTAEPTEVTRVVERTVEVQVTVPVEATRLVEVTRLIESEIEVTRLVAQEVEVTRIVEAGVSGDVTASSGVTDTIPALGEEYLNKGYFLIAEEVEDPAQVAERQQEDILEGEKVVSILVTIGNRDGVVDTIFPGSFNLVDDEGFVYEWSCCMRADDRDLGRFDDMLPGEQARGWMSFILPEDAQPAYIKYDMYEADAWLYAGLLE